MAGSLNTTFVAASGLKTAITLLEKVGHIFRYRGVKRLKWFTGLNLEPTIVQDHLIQLSDFFSSIKTAKTLKEIQRGVNIFRVNGLKWFAGLNLEPTIDRIT